MGFSQKNELALLTQVSISLTRAKEGLCESRTFRSIKCVNQWQTNKHKQTKNEIQLWSVLGKQCHWEQGKLLKSRLFFNPSHYMTSVFQLVFYHVLFYFFAKWKYNLSSKGVYVFRWQAYPSPAPLTHASLCCDELLKPLPFTSHIIFRREAESVHSF